MNYKNILKRTKTVVIASLSASALLLSACAMENTDVSDKKRISELTDGVLSDTDEKEDKTDKEENEGKDDSGAADVNAGEAEKIDLSESGDVKISDEGTYCLSGSLSDGMITVDAGDEDEIDLILDGVSVTNDTSAALYIKNAGKVNIILKEGSENELSVTGEFEAIDDHNIDAALFARKAEVSISGDGKLSVSCAAGHGIVSKQDLTLYAGMIEIDSKEDALHSDKNLTVKGGDISINAEDDALHSDSDLLIEDGNIKINECKEGLEGTSVTINGGNIDIIAKDDGINAANGGTEKNGSEENAAANDMFAVDEACIVTINGGCVNIISSGDGLDSNGNVEINGGEVYISGPENDGNAAFDYNGSAIINGGVFFATGMSGMAQGFSDGSSQAYMMLGFENGNAGDEIAVSDGNGNVLKSFTAANKYNSVLISLPDFTENGTYSVRAGSNEKEVTLSGKSYSEQGGMNGGFMRGQKGDFDAGMQNGERPEDGMMPPDMQNGERPEGMTPKGRK